MTIAIAVHNAGSRRHEHWSEERILDDRRGAGHLDAIKPPAR
jgi:hypothetical protein